VIARHLRDRPELTFGRDTERIPAALHDQGWNRELLELGQAARRRLRTSPARWLQRERQAQHGDCARLFRGPAGHAGTRRSPADDQALSR
jgi:hypothetical protein